MFLANKKDFVRDMDGSIPPTFTNSSGPSIGVSSLVTDGNSSLSSGAQFQNSTCMDVDSFMHIPASPVSFSSNNISSSSVNDESIMQQSPSQEQMRNRRSSSVTSQPGSEAGGAFHAPRVDISQDDILQQHLIQQLLQCESSLLEGQSYPQLQDLIWQLDLQAFMSDAAPLDPLSPIPPLSFAFENLSVGSNNVLESPLVPPTPDLQESPVAPTPHPHTQL